MTWTTPISPTTGTSIIGAFWDTYVKNNLLHLWGLFGGNPGSAGKVLVSTSGSAGAWGLVPDGAMQNPKVSKAGDEMTGLLMGTDIQLSGDLEAANATLSAALIANTLTALASIASNGGIASLDDIETTAGRLVASADVASGNGLHVAVGPFRRVGVKYSGLDEITFVTGNAGAHSWTIKDTGVLVGGASPPANRGSDYILMDGNAYSTGTWDTVSDERMKKAIEDVNNGVLAKLLKIRVVEFERKSTPGRREIGVLAQDVRQHIDNVIVEPVDEGGMLSLNTTSLVGALLKGIQEQSEQIETLRSQVQELQECIDTLT